MKTCGLFIFLDGKFLICHPTGSRWNQWSIPKGHLDKNETTLEAAIRETREETGLTLSKDLIYVKLPEQKYKNGIKNLVSFFIRIDEIPANWHPSCESITSGGYPEIDQWKWVLPDSIEVNYLHATQKSALKLLLETIK